MGAKFTKISKLPQKQAKVSPSPADYFERVQYLVSAEPEQNPTPQSRRMTRRLAVVPVRRNSFSPKGLYSSNLSFEADDMIKALDVAMKNAN